MSFFGDFLTCLFINSALCLLKTVLIWKKASETSKALNSFKGKQRNKVKVAGDFSVGRIENNSIGIFVITRTKKAFSKVLTHKF